MILLPQWALDELSAEDLNAVFLHELAHLKHWDDFTNLAQKIIKALLFFNPVVFWLESRLSLERELACDDFVLARTANPGGYARCLVTVAEKSFLRRGLALAQAAVTRMHQTSQRVTRILDWHRPPTIRTWKPALALVTVFSAAMIAAISRAPELIAFQSVTAPPTLAANFERTPAVIPASFHPSAVPVTNAPHKSARLGMARTRPLERRQRPMLVSAVFPVQHQLTTQTLLLVWQTRDGQKLPVWTLYVWRLSFVNSRQAPLSPVVPAKSI
jgi:hypothetical protein